MDSSDLPPWMLSLDYQIMTVSINSHTRNFIKLRPIQMNWIELKKTFPTPSGSLATRSRMFSVEDWGALDIPVHPRCVQRDWIHWVQCRKLEFLHTNVSKLHNVDQCMGHYHACWNRFGLGTLIIVQGHFKAKGHWGKKIIFSDVYVH